MLLGVKLKFPERICSLRLTSYIYPYFYPTPSPSRKTVATSITAGVWVCGLPPEHSVSIRQVS